MFCGAVRSVCPPRTKPANGGADARLRTDCRGAEGKQNVGVCEVVYLRVALVDVFTGKDSVRRDDVLGPAVGFHSSSSWVRSV